MDVYFSLLFNGFVIAVPTCRKQEARNINAIAVSKKSFSLLLLFIFFLFLLVESAESAWLSIKMKFSNEMGKRKEKRDRATEKEEVLIMRRHTGMNLLKKGYISRPCLPTLFSSFHTHTHTFIVRV